MQLGDASIFLNHAVSRLLRRKGKTDYNLDTTTTAVQKAVHTVILIFFIKYFSFCVFALHIRGSRNLDCDF